jgi:hypothetical protein
MNAFISRVRVKVPVLSTLIVVGTCQPVFLIRSVSPLPYNTMLTIIGQYISHGNQKTENTMTKKRQ